MGVEEMGVLSCVVVISGVDVRYMCMNLRDIIESIKIAC